MADPKLEEIAREFVEHGESDGVFKVLKHRKEQMLARLRVDLEQARREGSRERDQEVATLKNELAKVQRDSR